MPPSEDTVSKIFGKLDTLTTSVGHIEGDVRVIKEQMSHKAGTVQMMTYVEEKIREHWDWIIVPLKVEKESSEIDGSWDSMKE